MPHVGLSEHDDNLNSVSSHHLSAHVVNRLLKKKKKKKKKNVTIYILNFILVS